MFDTAVKSAVVSPGVVSMMNWRTTPWWIWELACAVMNCVGLGFISRTLAWPGWTLVKVTE